ncbi:MAG: hypothetical protein ACKOU7_01520 [Ferruginibacter sp.]
MLDEEMDDIIRKAAENHHPAYNDKAWEKMEFQLDKHLPQKKDRRKLIFFLLFFLLIGAGTYFALNRSGSNKNITAEKNTANTISGKPDAANVPGKNTMTGDKEQDAENTDENPVVNKENPGLNNNNNTATPASGDQLQPENKNVTEKLYNTKSLLSASKAKTKTSFTTPGLFTGQEDGADLSAQKRSNGRTSSGKQRVTIKAPEAEQANDAKSEIRGTDVNTDNTKSNSADETAIAKSNTTVVKELANSEKNKKEIASKTEDKSSSPSEKKKKKNSPGNNFGLTFSVGPDISFVKLNNTGKTTLTYGAGLSYSFAKRFTARAGFYVSKKIYDADPDQYHTPGGNYPHLTGVNADCKVYEIPVSIAYSFGKRGKHNWFGGAGLSSFIMKKEDYTYNYKNPAGQTYSYYQELNNKNKHYFAVLDLSAGYQYQLSKRLSVQAEPYLKLPLAGVGQGKIKLNSAGILFTVTLKPFAKKK